MPVTDVPGHYNFKAKLRDEFLPSARAIILVVDSKDKDRLAEAADILYDVVSDIDLATAGVPVLVVCNK
jgi:signal recognition particle receptor subunit beta